MCDFSTYSEEWSDEYDPDFCPENSNYYNYSHGLYGSFVYEGNEVLPRHYYLNNPTCLKKGCADVEAFYYNYQLPYHFNMWLDHYRKG